MLIAGRSDPPMNARSLRVFQIVNTAIRIGRSKRGARTRCVSSDGWRPGHPRRTRFSDCILRPPCRPAARTGETQRSAGRAAHLLHRPGARAQMRASQVGIDELYDCAHRPRADALVMKIEPLASRETLPGGRPHDQLPLHRSVGLDPVPEVRAHGVRILRASREQQCGNDLEAQSSCR